MKKYFNLMATAIFTMVIAVQGFASEPIKIGGQSIEVKSGGLEQQFKPLLGLFGTLVFWMQVIATGIGIVIMASSFINQFRGQNIDPSEVIKSVGLGLFIIILAWVVPTMIGKNVGQNQGAELNTAYIQTTNSQ
jgi:hypothetical protein